MKNKIKVLMVGPARDVKGGMTTVVNNYFSCGLPKEVELKYIESINDKNKISKFFKEKQGLREFKKTVQNYDIVHIHMASRRSTYRKIQYIKIAKKYNKAIILHIHGGGFRKFFEKETTAEQRKTIINNLNSTNTVIVLSEEWQKYFSKILTTKIVTLENSVSVPADFVKEKNNKIIFLGRLNAEKGILELLNSIAYIKKNTPDVLLYIAGAGEEDKKIDEKIKELKIEKNVKKLGWIDEQEKIEYLREANFFALPSYFEAMPMSLLEAMSYKCIPIASKIGSIPTVISNSRNGFLVEPHNQNQLNMTLEKALNMNAMQRKKIANAARKTIEKQFNENSMLEKLIRTYYERQK